MNRCTATGVGLMELPPSNRPFSGPPITSSKRMTSPPNLEFTYQIIGALVHPRSGPSPTRNSEYFMIKCRDVFHIPLFNLFYSSIFLRVKETWMLCYEITPLILSFWKSKQPPIELKQRWNKRDLETVLRPSVGALAQMMEARCVKVVALKRAFA